jgi:hypothetical protein
VGVACAGLAIFSSILPQTKGLTLKKIQRLFDAPQGGTAPPAGRNKNTERSDSAEEAGRRFEIGRTTGLLFVLAGFGSFGAYNHHHIR